MKESKKRERTKVKNPITGEVTWEWRDKITIRYAEEEKLPIILEFLKGDLTAEEMTEKYHICSVQTLFAWVGRYLAEKEFISLQNKLESDEDMANKSKDDQIKELKAALKKAQKEAELEKLRAHAYDKMIDLAEEHFNIPIRKKSGTKQ
jgi:hypothetical protein